MADTQRQLGEADERALTAQRNLRLARDALRVKSDLSSAASAAATATFTLSVSPGGSSRFPTSNHDLPLAASPALRAPPPVSWGSGPVMPGGVVAGNGDGGGAGGSGGGGKGADGGLLRGGGGVGGGRGDGGDLLVGRTQEMGVRFALDTLRYSEDQEVVVFMLHLVQVCVCCVCCGLCVLCMCVVPCVGCVGCVCVFCVCWVGSCRNGWYLKSFKI